MTSLALFSPNQAVTRDATPISGKRTPREPSAFRPRPAERRRHELFEEYGAARSGVDPRAGPWKTRDMLDAIALPPPRSTSPSSTTRPGSPERAALKAELARDGRRDDRDPDAHRRREVTTGDLARRALAAQAIAPPRARAPGRRGARRAGDRGGARRARRLVAHAARRRAPAIFLKAAELLATRLRPVLNAATMLGQSKTAHQAEIDAACELIDFLRFNVHFARRIAGRAARSRPGHLERARAPSARGLRLRRHAVQLHRHRRQPPDRARADGQHRRVEARRRTRCSRRTT